MSPVVVFRLILYLWLNKVSAIEKALNSYIDWYLARPFMKECLCYKFDELFLLYASVYFAKNVQFQIAMLKLTWGLF